MSNFRNQTCTSIHALNNEVCVVMSNEFELMRQTWGQFLFELLFGAGMYGVNLILSSGTIIVLLHSEPGVGQNKASKHLLTTLVLMLILATTYIVVSVVSMFKLQYIPAHTTDITIFATSLEIPIWAELNIWRCYILYGKSIKMIIFPVFTAVVGAGVGLCANLGTFDSANMVNSIWAALTAISTLYCTTAIARKIYTSMRFSQRISNLFPVFVIIVETGVIYTSVLIIYLITTLINNTNTAQAEYAQVILTAIIAQLPPLVLCMLVLQLKFFQNNETVQHSISETSAAGLWAAFRRAFRPAKDTPDDSPMSTFRVASGAVHSTSQTQVETADTHRRSGLRAHNASASDVADVALCVLWICGVRDGWSDLRVAALAGNLRDWAKLENDSYVRSMRFVSHQSKFCQGSVWDVSLRSTRESIPPPASALTRAACVPTPSAVTVTAVPIPNSIPWSHKRSLARSPDPFHQQETIGHGRSSIPSNIAAPMAGANKSLLGRKRSAPTTSSAASAKRKKLSTNELPWKAVARSAEDDIDFDEGILGLEEVDDVEVVYEEMPGGGRVARFNVLESALEKMGEAKADYEASETGIEELEELEEELDLEEQESAAEEGSQFDKTPSPEPSQEIAKPVAFDPKLIPEWSPFDLDIRLQRALYAQKFISPTPIQSQAIPKAVENRDIIGVAETGSGKTLAYGLPILNALLAEKSAQEVPSGTRRQVRALILAPTRELALQVSTHLNACLNDYDLADLAIKTEDAEDPSLGPSTGKGKGKKPSKAQQKGKGKSQPSGPKKPPLVSVAAIVGGMSAQKQKRILERGVDVLVATPGRLWDILEEDDELAKGVKNLRYLVLDEADRMIETGHFAELDNILRLTQRETQHDVTDPDFHGGSAEESDGESSDSVDDHARSTSPNMQTFVFSATLSKDLQRNLKKRHKPRPLKKGEKPASTLDDLISRLDFRDPEPEVIDLSPEGGVVSTLQESRIDCLSEDKDIYLYYFLLRYPGRSLVFLSSIDGIRRLLPMLELLGLPAFPLHSQLEQRQRLKNLDRFKSHENAVLLATDIAARGLDIPSVDHVVHYQIPRTADSYVHRNGRTARARRSGFSMLMCAPDERRLVRALLGSLGRQESDIPEMAVDHHLLDKLKPRLQLAKQIDNAQHKTKKENHERNWLKATADAMDIELGTDFEQSDGENTAPTKSKIKARNAKVATLKAELKELLSQPLVARGVSTRYITSGSRPIVDDILAGEYHEGLIGVKKSEASNDLVHPKKGAKKAGAAQKEKKEDYEEWGGFGS
ncbi:hypothetical protein EVG20_g1974 [Dentipellis fragilis]|uniref:RNA helicase n=1 Tax=Dentipellis fragilis TaxID=205917 RepID=A0A4Y9Z8D3_9AGAM|nr:hypothetical protein EVG20_g1974 [Dentipellis fragilis]